MGALRVKTYPYPKLGEVWRWHNKADHPSYAWDDLWMMLANDHPNPNAFLAINLETGEVMDVFPIHSPDDWEHIL